MDLFKLLGDLGGDAFNIYSIEAQISLIVSSISKYVKGNFAKSLEYHIGTISDCQDINVTGKKISAQVRTLAFSSVIAPKINNEVQKYNTWSKDESKQSEALSLKTQIESDCDYLEKYINGINRYTIVNLKYEPKEQSVYCLQPTIVVICNALKTIRGNLDKDIEKLNGTKYNNLAVRGPGLLKTVNIRSKANIVINNINALKLRIERIEKSIETQMSNLLKFEAGESVTITNNKQVGEAKSEPKTHTVTNKDSLWSLAEKYYGDGSRYKEIQDANNIKNPNFLPNGLVLTIPGIVNTSDSNETVIKSEDAPNIGNIKTPGGINLANWGVDAGQMTAGKFNTPIALNSEGNMVDINGNEIRCTYTMEDPDYKSHRGIDLSGYLPNGVASNDAGTKIYTIGPGIVVNTYKTAVGNYGQNNGYGNCVRVLHEVVDEKGNVSYMLSTYAHLKNVPDNINVGTVIDSGTQIGTMGNTGNSKGEHLHLEMTKVPFLEAEDLSGKNATEIAEMWKDGDRENRQQPDGHWHYGRKNWIDPQDYIEEMGWVDIWGYHN